MRITILGAGYVGLVSAACLASSGHRVTCIDTDADRIAMLQRGEVPIHEPGLDALIAQASADSRLHFTTAPARAIASARIVMICVGTPSNPEGGAADLGFVFEAARSIARHARNGTVVVTKSTVPVGTGDRIETMIRQLRPDLTVDVVSNPEFLREGAAITDFMKPDRIVIGAETTRANDWVAALYKGPTWKTTPILHVRRRAAEVIKYASNAFLAVKLSFINEIADFCEAWDSDVDAVACGIGLDSRIGPAFLQPGPGYGGSCFPKDLRALIHSARERAINLRIVEAADSVNAARRWAMGRRIPAALPGGVAGRRIAVLGLAFKADTDDLRESPALAVITTLKHAGADLCLHDPEAMPGARKRIAGVEFADTAHDCLRGADALILATAWSEYVALDPQTAAALMPGRDVFDLRNALPATPWQDAGFRVHRIGAPTPAVSPQLVPDPDPDIATLAAHAAHGPNLQGMGAVHSHS